MNTRLGKSFGLAFMVAVGILALMFALGTFNAQKVGAQEADGLVLADSITVTPNDPAPGATEAFTVTFQAQTAIEDFERLAVELEGFTVPSPIEKTAIHIRLYTTGSTKTGDPTSTGFADDVSVSGNVITLEINDDTDVDSDIAIPANTWVDLVIRQRAGLAAPAEAGTYAASVAEETNDEAVTVSASLSVKPGKGGADTEITVSGKAFADGTGSLWTEALADPDFNNDGIIDTLIEGTTNPTESQANDWGLNVDGDDDAEYGLLEVAAVDASDGPPVVLAADAYYTAVLLDDEGALTGDNTAGVMLGYKITLAPDPGDDPPADAPEVGTPTMPPATYDSDNAEFLKDVTVDDGAFSTTVEGGDLVIGGEKGRSRIRINDADSTMARAVFQVTGTVTLGADSVGKGRILKISLSDWIVDVPDQVKIGGIVVADAADTDHNADTEDADDGEGIFLDEDGKKTDPPVDTDLDEGAMDIYVKVIGTVRLGTKTVVLSKADERLNSASVEITASDLNVSPSTAVVGREVTVTGSGFTGSVASIEVGDATVCDNNDAATDNDCDIQVASGGRVVAAFDIPNKAVLADADDYTIMITDGSGRIGTGTVTIPEPTLMADPPESRINSTINLTGADWPTGTGANLVAIYYDGIQYGSAISKADGSWSASLTVPAAAGVGTTHDVEAKATVGDDGEDNVTQKEDHKTPDPVVALSSAQAQRGTTITVSGDNFHTFQPVTIEIGGATVATSDTTDGDGSFSADVLVPGLSLGNKNLKVTVNDVPVVEFLEIVATPVSTTTASADAFADLIAMDNLIVVWHFDNTTKAWSFYDPRPEVAAAVDLTMVSSGDIVWIQVTADQDFPAATPSDLSAGWNQVTLN